MNRTICILTLILFCTSSINSQNYFTGELFEAYEWNMESLSKVDIRLESDLIMRRRMLNKKEKRFGKRIKENKQYYDEVIIGRKTDLKLVKIRGNQIEFELSKHPDFTLVFGPNNKDDENYTVMVEEMKGDKGVIEYKGMPFRLLQGSKLLIGRLKKRKLPPRRTSKISSKWSGNATAIMIDGNGYLLTNYHVIENANEIVVVSPRDYTEELKAKVIIKDENNDLAILKITDKNYNSIKEEIPFSLSSKIKNVGADVFTLGYPLALDNMGQEVKFTKGSISSKTGYNDDINAYQISVPIQPGNSGGPLFDTNGNLVGIVNSKIVGQTVDNVSYAIKIPYAKTLIESSNENIRIPSGSTEGDIESLIQKFDDFVFMVKTN